MNRCEPLLGLRQGSGNIGIAGQDELCLALALEPRPSTVQSERAIDAAIKAQIFARSALHAFISSS
jgi:hypothetical protein